MDAESGWTTVIPTTPFGVERLPRQQLEFYERQVLKEWEASKGHWSGL